MKAVITLQNLVDKGACSLMVRRFKKLFGDRVVVTIKKAKEHSWDFRMGWAWAADVLLTAKARQRFFASWNKKGYWDLIEKEQEKLDAETFARLFLVPSNRRKM